MDLAIFERQLRLLALLTKHHGLTVEQISNKMSINRRTIYRYIDLYSRMGFDVRKKGTTYKIGPSSPFFDEITSRIRFTEDEAVTINQLLNAVNKETPQIRHLKDKLADLYDHNVLCRVGLDERVAHNIGNIYTAIKNRRVVVLRGYSSLGKKHASDRIVEPYMFLTDNAEVRCFEIATKTNKTFKLSRAKRVDVLDVEWIHMAEHKVLHTDLFHFSGEESMTVQLLLGSLSTSLLIEEHPAAVTQLKLQKDGRHLLTTQVCNYKGIGRFVLGLYDDIEIVDSPEFLDYMRRRIKAYAKKMRATERESKSTKR